MLQSVDNPTNAEDIAKLLSRDPRKQFEAYRPEKEGKQVKDNEPTLERLKDFLENQTELTQYDSDDDRMDEGKHREHTHGCRQERTRLRGATI